MKPVKNRDLAVSMIMRSTHLTTTEAAELLDVLLDVVREEVLCVPAKTRWSTVESPHFDGRGRR